MKFTTPTKTLQATSTLVEIIYSRKVAILPAPRASGELQLSCVLDTGESVVWSANLYKLKND
jgi:hypothetical protein